MDNGHPYKAHDMQTITKTFNHYRKEFLAGIIFPLAFGPTFIWMWDRWFAADSYYSHGILIPFVTAYLIWQLRDELKKITPEESPYGIWLIGLGIFIHLVSLVLRVYFTSGFSMIMVFSGLILFFRGEKFFSKIIFPVGFLAFMVPLPMVAIANLSFQLKLFAAQIATYLLNHVIGVPALRDGSMIKMRNSVVVVEDVCSGLRSLISLTALGAIFAYWFKGFAVKRMVLFLSTIPIAIATNVFRILFLSIVSEVWGTQYATGFIHDFSGFMVFALAFVMLAGVSKLLES